MGTAIAIGLMIAVIFFIVGYLFAGSDGTNRGLNRNHMLMARWIDRQLSEQYVSTEQTQEAEALLKKFYGKSPKELR